MVTRDEIRGRIDENIRAHGWHRYSIRPGPLPAWSYTIGLHETSELPELVVAGRGSLTDDDVRAIFERSVEAARTNGPEALDVVAADLGLVVRPVHRSWCERLLLGAEERYGQGYDARQLAPAGWTIDIPNMEQPFSVAAEPAWRWLEEPWPYTDAAIGLAKEVLTVTDLEALAGAPLHEVARVAPSEVEWECWASRVDPIPPSDQRVAPLGLFLAVDPTIGPIIDLDEGEWATRSSPAEPWEQWSE